MNLSHHRELDLILIGRAGVDFNAGQLNCHFAEIETFTKSVGGSPANIAQGIARLGLKTGFIGKVSGDGMGDYVIETLQKAGIDVSGIVRDRTGAKNCLAITEIINPGENGSFLYREQTADLFLAPEEISEAYVSSAAAVLISGTALSYSPSREAVFVIIDYARRNGTLVMLDLDFRPFGWKSSFETAIYYSMVAEKCDVIIGNREEFNAVEYVSMPNNRDDRRSAEALLAQGAKLIIIKDGPKGSCAYRDDGEIIQCGIIQSDVKKCFGSGDAYASGLFYGLFKGMALADAMELGTACASIVLTGAVSCVDNLPTFDQATDYLREHPLEPYQKSRI
ncbi:MAG: 5-dehydro-2-deoxygluconokinase [Eubacteriales bacterium]|nr:5-dehydro-2-deoxygluconokinase [Eubacteriales bacterium]